MCNPTTAAAQHAGAQAAAGQDGAPRAKPAFPPPRATGPRPHIACMHASTRASACMHAYLPLARRLLLLLVITDARQLNLVALRGAPRAPGRTHWICGARVWSREVVACAGWDGQGTATCNNAAVTPQLHQCDRDAAAA
eukprot:364652-Chlamydomonas_euryale.AAC.3